LLELGYNLPSFFKNRRLLRAGGFQFIYERHAFFLFSSALLARSVGIPLIIEVNELAGDARIRDQPWLGWLVRSIDRFVFERASLIVVVSPHLQRRISALGIPGEKILALPNAVKRADAEQLADGTSARRMLGVEDCVVIGFVGWFVHWHRLDRLLIAMAHLGQQRPNLRLVLVGEGPLEPELRMLASKLGIGERVVFAGPAPHNEIPSRIAAFDVAVVPHSNAYRSPIKLFEYMAQARAVVAPDTEPIASVVSHGENGLLFNPDEESALEQCLEQALTSADLRTALGENARRAVLERHTWEANAARLLRALNLSPSPGIPAGTGAPLRPKAGLPVDEQQS
jgi:glycosyltransferase involved in cell wall biosynthesis